MFAHFRPHLVFPKNEQDRDLVPLFYRGGSERDGLEMFPVVRLEVPQSQRSLRNVSAARTFHNHDGSPFLDMFEARRRTVPTADLSEG